MAAVTIPALQKMKEEGVRISMTTAYDYPTACLVEKAGIEIILVGDSLAMTVLGMDSTVPVTMDEMVHHIKPVVKGAPTPLIVGDMPFGSYQVSLEEAVANAIRLMKEGGCDTVKLEGGSDMAPVVKRIVKAGVPVMGHIGLTPQTVSMLGGFKVQGKGEAAAKALLQDALDLQEAGAWGLIIEAVPENVARLITEKVTIPTIGIGGGRYCDGQVLVFHDMFGLFDKFLPKFVKQYAQLGEQIVTGLETFKEDVREARFPEEKHVFGGVSEEELKRLY